MIRTMIPRVHRIERCAMKPTKSNTKPRIITTTPVDDEGTSGQTRANLMRTARGSGFYPGITRLLSRNSQSVAPALSIVTTQIEQPNAPIAHREGLAVPGRHQECAHP